MAADERRAKRIQALKKAHPELTWKEIADYVGVSERSAHSWRATGEIGPKNARKLTAFFQGLGDPIPDDYVWRGDHEEVPNLMDVLGSEPPQGNIIEGLLREVLSRLDGLAQLAGRVDQLEERLDLLRGQQAASDLEALARHEEVLRAIRRQPPEEQQR